MQSNAFRSSRLRIVVTGLIAQHPRIGGMAWHYAQYAAGLRELGHDVFYLEDSGEWPYTEDGGESGDEWIAQNCDANTTHLDSVMRRWGLENRWAYRFPLKDEWFGMPSSLRNDVLNSADLLINVSGSLEFPEKYRAVRRLAYIDSDPVFTQSRILNGTHGLAARVDCHDVHFSFGERVGELPLDTGHNWLPTRQPVMVREWQTTASPRTAFSTVMNWTSYSPAVVDGVEFGQKDREFAKFIGVAKEVAPLKIKVAMGKTQHTEWEGAPFLDNGSSVGVVTARSPHALLSQWGWETVESSKVCGDLQSYRDFIHSSRGEWSIAKEAYAAHRPGWFSERSSCYLASGRPVVVQDTGFGVAIPCGVGVIAFSNVEEAVDGILEVDRSYAKHSAAAREIAETCFDSSVVLTDLIERAMADAA